MKRTIDIDKEYRLNAPAAIKRFFGSHKSLDYWKEAFEWMYENKTDHFNDCTFADGTKNKNWTYSLWLDVDDKYTYIAIVERE